MKAFILKELTQIIECYEDDGEAYSEGFGDCIETLQNIVSDLRCLRQNVRATPTYCPDCKVIPLEKTKHGLWCSKCLETKKVEN